MMSIAIRFKLVVLPRLSHTSSCFCRFATPFKSFQEHGEGVSQSREEALHWWRAAATQGHVNSMYLLGVAGVHEGHGDREEALEWLRTAAAKGHEGAREALQHL